MPGPQQQQQQHCSMLPSVLHLLRSAPNEHKLAGLLLATKLTKSASPEPHTICALADALGTQFLRRMLKSHVHSSSNEASPQYAHLALNIMSALASDSTVANSYVDANLLPLICDCITLQTPEQVFQDAFSIWDACVHAGCAVSVLNSGCLSLILHRVGAAAAASDSNQSQAPLQMLAKATGWVALDAVDACARKAFAQSVLCPNPSHTSSSWLILASTLFANESSSLKFDLLEALTAFLAHLSGFVRQIPMEDGARAWCVPVRQGLEHILGSRVRAKHRRLSLILSRIMLDMCGQHWAVFADDGKPHEQFVLVLINSVSVEAKVLLESRVERGTDADDAAEVSDTDTIRCCFAIVELTVEFLVEEDSRWAQLPPERLLALQKRLNDVVQASFGFLRDCESEQCTSDVLLSPCIRLLGTMCSEDPASFSTMMMDMLPFIRQLCNDRIISRSCVDDCFASLALDDADDTSLTTAFLK